MVLQRAPQRSRIWGAAGPGVTVTVTLQPSGAKHVTTADVNGTWRVVLPPMAASLGHTLNVSSSSGESATLSDIAFGDVFLCGGQSNMVFAVPAMTNATAEIAAADRYPHIRIFTVGIGTQSAVPLRDLQTVREGWQVASSRTISQDVTPGHTLFATFSAVCWVFGRTLSDALTEAGHSRAGGGPVPVGLVSNNWGGTRVEQWMPADAIAPCTPSNAIAYTSGSTPAGAAEHGASPQAGSGADSALGSPGLLLGSGGSDAWAGDGQPLPPLWYLHEADTVNESWMGSPPELLPSSAAEDSHLYNAMILPYAEGPMELSGAIWYQVRAEGFIFRV